VPKNCLAGHQGSPLHNDWWWPFSYVPRAWTSFCRGRFARPPRYLFGNLRRDDPADWGKYSNSSFLERIPRLYPKPVPQLGKWYFAWPFYFAWTFDLFCRWRVLLRFGCRYTEVTNKAGKFDPTLSYYTVPAGPAIRDIGGV